MLDVGMFLFLLSVNEEAHIYSLSVLVQLFHLKYHIQAKPFNFSL